ncbi:flavodoxin domain-containing protein [Neobacillus sp. PS2-9]|uniref:flavodoxin domain-containing protein n=1 Tax=Neobacillus sp. PS2-9 TaxID=3070676 RepID=UPI0027E026AA|nr:flavodoxin domain-containing protein [Neobacillus sp. PS2-9]WML60475.1 flavodoxin domain-containing protein [Neobacillus sp. PS2-9]
MKIAIVYSSKTGNTEELVHLIQELFNRKKVVVKLFRIEQFPINDLSNYEAIVIGTYTWGNGNIPHEMMGIFRAFKTEDVKNIVTAVVGTGDSGYLNFCGAVDEFKTMLYYHTHLAVTLKIEVSPQKKDLSRCIRFVEIVLEKVLLYRSDLKIKSKK